MSSYYGLTVEYIRNSLFFKLHTDAPEVECVLCYLITCSVNVESFQKYLDIILSTKNSKYFPKQSSKEALKRIIASQCGPSVQVVVKYCFQHYFK
jgi:hypothetical protein